jgi:hypothetical protein
MVRSISIAPQTLTNPTGQVAVKREMEAETEAEMGTETEIKSGLTPMNRLAAVVMTRARMKFGTVIMLLHVKGLETESVKMQS